MVKINDVQHFREALQFAKTLPKDSRRSLRRCFTTLNRIKRNGKREGIAGPVVLRLYPDWVKHSWAFCLFDTSTMQAWFNGGLILHGFEETLSIEINPSNGPHWSIHT